MCALKPYNNYADNLQLCVYNYVYLVCEFSAIYTDNPMQEAFSLQLTICMGYAVVVRVGGYNIPLQRYIFGTVSYVYINYALRLLAIIL